MSSRINYFNIFNDFPPNFITENCKIFYICGNKYGYCVTKEDKVYLLNPNESFEEIIELSDKNIESFYEGNYFMFARNVQNEIFSWGLNKCGQLARGNKSDENQKPKKVKFFDGKNIIHISCGDKNCMALSSDGLIYGWGDNRKGQIKPKSEGQIFYYPKEIVFKSKIKFINCNKDTFLAVCFDGNAYYWDNSYNQNTYSPSPIPVKNTIKIYNFSQDYIILDSGGNIYRYFPLKSEAVKIINDVKFIDLYCDDDYCLAQSDDCVYLLNDIFEKTIFINFFDFYSRKPIKFKNTIQIIKDTFIASNEIKLKENSAILTLVDKFFFQRKFLNNFEYINEIDSGNFSTVYSAKERSSRQSYAIKRIHIDDLENSNLKEIQIMSKLNSEFIAKYFYSWIERKIKHNQIKVYLFIQMELCSMNLRKFIKLLPFEDQFRELNYFISFELLIELIECVNYLHSLKPPIIHRDLKPENILISDGNNGRFLKLSDFGLSKYHDKSSHTRMVGTFNYMAREVLNSRQYNTKSDIYSLALIATEIFGFKDDVKTIRSYSNLKTYIHFFENTQFDKQFKDLLKILENCIFQKKWKERPDSQYLLQKINELVIDPSSLSDYQIILNFRENFKNKMLENKIAKLFFQSKFENLSQNKYFIKRLFSFNSEIEEINLTKKRFFDQNIFEKKYVNSFDEIKEIGWGSFGQVYELKQKTNIPFTELDDDFEDFCLREIFHHFIWSEIIKELIQFVNVLFSLTIIKRNLKLTNILIFHEKENFYLNRKPENMFHLKLKTQRLKQRNQKQEYKKTQNRITDNRKAVKLVNRKFQNWKNH